MRKNVSRQSRRRHYTSGARHSLRFSEPGRQFQNACIGTYIKPSKNAQHGVAVAKGRPNLASSGSKILSHCSKTDSRPADRKRRAREGEISTDQAKDYPGKRKQISGIFLWL
jgi:hypothetical protein